MRKFKFRSEIRFNDLRLHLIFAFFLNDLTKFYVWISSSQINISSVLVGTGCAIQWSTRLHMFNPIWPHAVQLQIACLLNYWRIFYA